MKHFNTLSLFLLLALTLQAQIPAGYYTSANGKHGAALKTALYDIISKGVTVRTYTQIWEDFKSTDVDGNGYIIDRYTNTTQYTPGTDQGTTGSAIGDGYNREHSMPKSWFNEGSPMYTDLMHLIPADCYVNTRRSNYPFGATSGNTYDNGYTKLGTSTVSGYTGTVFEPADEYKGDFARIYFYMVTRNENVVATWSSPMLSSDKYPAISSWALPMLLTWAKNDPVSQLEIDRNNTVYSIQGNRNPFVDYEGLEQHIWGDFSDQAVDFSNYTSPYSRTDATGNGGVETGISNTPTLATTLYQLVTTTAQLDAAITAGKKFILAGSSLSDYAQQNYVMTSTLSSSYYRSVAYVPNTDNFIDVSLLPSAAIFNLAKNSNGYTLNFDGTSNYLQSTAARSVSAALATTAPTEGTSVWTIDFTDGVATIANTTTTNGSLRFNYNSGNTPRFTTYTTNVSNILQLAQLYVQTTNGTSLPEAPIFSSANGSTVAQGTVVTITSATSGATLYYSTDNGNTWTAGNSFTLNTIGTTTIQAKAVLNGSESSIATVSYTVVASNTSTFQQITSINDLEVGARYLIVNENNGKTLGTQSANNFSAASIEINNHTTTINDDGTVQILTLGGEAGSYTFRTPSSTYLTLGSNSNYLRTATSVSGNDQRWTIAFESTGNVTILNKSYTTREIKYNSGNTLFACYTSGQQKCQLYKEVINIPIDVPTFSPDGGTINAGADITITAVGTDANVMYKIDDAATWSGGISQTAVITLSTAGTHTITAKSVSTNNESTSVTKTFTVVDHVANYYERIYSTDDLVDGWEYLIVYSSEGANKAIGSWQSSKSSYTALDATIENDKIDLASDTEGLGTVTLVSSTNGTFALQVSNKYIGYSGSSTNLSTSSTLSSDNFRWNISITNGIAQIQNAGTNTRYLGYGAATTPVSFKAYTIGSNTNLQIFAKRSSSFNISKWGWGTYYDQRAYTMPEGVTGVTITDGLADVESLEVGNTYNAGDIVPGNTALLLYGDGGTSGMDYDFNFYYPADKPANYSGTSNLLHGSMAGIAASDMATASGVSSDDYYFYKLTTKSGANVGFYWGAEGGVPFQMNNGHKCWLTLLKTKGAATLGFALDLDNLINNGKIITINTMPSTTANQPSAIYDLQGRRVTKPLNSGIYIINGKKTFIP